MNIASVNPSSVIMGTFQYEVECYDCHCLIKWLGRCDNENILPMIMLLPPVLYRTLNRN